MKLAEIQLFKANLPQLLASLHDEIEAQLGIARKGLAHPTVKGDASESLWLDLLRTYRGGRYAAQRAHVVDSKGAFSERRTRTARTR